MAGQEDTMPIPEQPKIFIERTLAIIKPDAVHKLEEIKDIILRTGFSILSVSQCHCCHLSVSAKSTVCISSAVSNVTCHCQQYQQSVSAQLSAI